MSGNVTKETLDLIKAAQPQSLVGQEIAKAYNQATGLVFYDLEPAAKLLYPVLTPLRNEIPRVSGDGGTATNWKVITAINTGGVRAGVGEGNRGGVISITAADRTAAYRGLGLEDNVTFEAQDAGKNFDDVRSLAQLNLLRATMIQEERVILGGNSSLALGTTPTPTVAGSGSGGSLATQTLSVICVALTLAAFKEASIAGGVPVGGTRTNADGSTDTVNGGWAQKSTAGTASLTGPNASATATVAHVAGAVAYAWYWGVAGSELLGAITTLNSVAITANAAGTQNASALTASDKSRDTLVFDGLLTQIWTSGSGSVLDVAATGTPGVGTAFTSDGAGGVTEVESVLFQFWDNAKLSPEKMRVSGKTLQALNKLVIANGGAPLIRYAMDAGGQNIVAGTVIGGYLNKITNTTIKIEVHPDMPDGMILYTTSTVPYPLSGVGNVVQMKLRRDYYSIEWPQRSRKYEFGVYLDGLLQNYFTPGFGIQRGYKV